MQPGVRTVGSLPHEGRELSDEQRASPSLLDERMLRELRELDTPDHPGFLSDLVTDFITRSRRELQEIDDSIASGDPETAWRLAHGLKGASHMVAAVRLADAIAGVEGVLRRGDLEGAAARLVALRGLYEDTCIALRALTPT